MKTNVVLIGPMGCGKSTVGRSLADRLNYQFIDTDAELVKRTGVPISTIFEIEGEAGFRDRETKLLEEMLQTDRIVLATGGGIALKESNRKLLKEIGSIVFLNATEDILFSRLEHCKDRPLLQNGDRRQIIRQLLEERTPIYHDLANIIIDTGKYSIRVMVNKMITMLDTNKSSTV